MMRANWARRILFLADRVALVNQAVGAFKKFLPSASPVNSDHGSRGDGPRLCLDLSDHDALDR